MMQWIIDLSTKFRLLAITVSVALLATGIIQLRDTPLEALPDFGPVHVDVQTEALGLAPEEVENLITNPMEQEFFNGIPWLHKLRSDSLSGLSSLQMIFEPGTDPIRARQVVQERLTMVPALPQVSQKPIVINPLATTSRVMVLGLSSKTHSLVDVSVLTRWKIRQRLLSVPGVANVTMWGLRDRQLQVLVDMNQLRQNGVALQQVIRTSGNAMWSSPLTYVEASTPGIGGFIDTANQRLEIQHVQPIQSAKELARVTIEGAEDRSLTLGQVADVTENHQPLIGDAIVQDKPGLMLVVERSPGSSVSEVTRGIEQAINAMRPGLSGIDIDTDIFRAASFVEAARNNLVGALGVGFVLLVLLLGACLFNWRAALIGTMTIALSLSVAWLVLSALGAALNMVVVAGLVMALALIVDDGIVDVDNIRRRLQQRRAEGSSASVIETIVAASLEMRGSILTAVSIVIVSVVPVLVLGEVSGDFLRPLAFSYTLAVLVSMLVALTLTPALAVALFSREVPGDTESLLANRLGHGYSTLLRAVVRRPVWMAAAVAVITLGGLGVLAQFGGTSLTPALQDRHLLVRVEGVSGVSLPAMVRIATAASKEIRSLSGVRNVGGHIGRASTSDKVISVHGADLWVNIDSGADYAATIDAIKRTFAEGYPGLRATVTTYPNMRIREVTEDTNDDLVVRVYGRKFEVLRAKAEEVVGQISRVVGVVGPQVRLPILEPTIEIEVSVPKAAAHGVKPGDVRRAAATIMSGITAGTLFNEQKIFNVVVWGKEDKRNSLTSIREIQIDTPRGGLVSLKEVADVRLRSNPSVIKHDAVSRYVDVTAQVRGRSLDTVIGDVNTRLKGMTFPAEHHVELLGEETERRTTLHYLLSYAIAALVAVLFLLQARFSSWRLAALLFVLLPVPLAGAALAGTQLPGTLSVLSLMGGLTVLASTVRSGILLVDRYRRLEHEEGKTFGLDLVMLGSQQRFGASLLSVLATGVALVPLVVYGAVSGLEIVAPLAVVVLSGLFVTALLNLFVLPAFYLQFGAGTQREASGVLGR